MGDIKTEVWFLAFCVEIYKSKKIMNGQEAYNYLLRTGAADFIIECCESLHTTGEEYIVDSIDEFISNNYQAV